MRMKRVGGDKSKMASINDVVIMAVSFFLVAILGPMAIGMIANTTTTNWSASVVTMFQVLLPILWVIGVAIMYVPKVKRS